MDCMQYPDRLVKVLGAQDERGWNGRGPEEDGATRGTTGRCRVGAQVMAVPH